MNRFANLITVMSIFIFVNCALALPTSKKSTLQWTPPTTNVDGSTLTDLGGYKIYWSQISGSYNDIDSKDVGNISISSIPVTIPGIYYFVVTTYDLYGNESGFSNEVKINIFRGITPPVIEGK